MEHKKSSKTVSGSTDSNPLLTYTYAERLDLLYVWPSLKGSDRLLSTSHNSIAVLKPKGISDVKQPYSPF